MFQPDYWFTPTLTRRLLKPPEGTSLATFGRGTHSLVSTARCVTLPVMLSCRDSKFGSAFIAVGAITPGRFFCQHICWGKNVKAKGLRHLEYTRTLRKLFPALDCIHYNWLNYSCSSCNLVCIQRTVAFINYIVLLNLCYLGFNLR